MSANYFTFHFQVWTKYRYKLGIGNETWSDDGAKNHAVEYGVTLCRHPVKTSWESGWEIDNYGRSPDAVDCKLCLRQLEKFGYRVEVAK